MVFKATERDTRLAERKASSVSQRERAPTRTLTFSTYLCWARKMHHSLTIL